MESKLLTKIGKIPNEKYIFWVTLVFYIFLLVVNPPNKFIAFSFIPLLLIYYLKIGDISQSLLFTFVSSGIVMTGKTYPIQIIPPGLFQTDVFPYGYFINIVISSSVFISFAMLLATIRALISKTHNFRLNFLDLLIIIFYFLKILSATLGSKEPHLSLPLEILGLTSFFAYFYVRVTIKITDSLWKMLACVISALVIFESVLGIMQLMSKSPLDKNIEYQVNLEYFGNTLGETQFTFRPVGTFDHANSFGIWLAASGLFLLAAVYKNRSAIIWVAFFMGCILMITTISRSAWLGFFGGFVFLVTYLSRRSKNLLKPLLNFVLKWRLILIPCVLILFLFFVVPRINDSIYSFRPDAGGAYFRKVQISDAVEIIKLHPIFGIGAGMSAYEGVALDLYTLTAKVPLEVHNWYLGIALENGLPSLFIILLFVLYSLKKNFESYPNSIIRTSVAGVIICSAISGILQPYFNFGLILLLLSIINGDTITGQNAKANP